MFNARSLWTRITSEQTVKIPPARVTTWTVLLDPLASSNVALSAVANVPGFSNTFLFAAGRGISTVATQTHVKPSYFVEAHARLSLPPL